MEERIKIKLNEGGRIHIDPFLVPFERSLSALSELLISLDNRQVN